MKPGILIMSQKKPSLSGPIFAVLAGVVLNLLVVLGQVEPPHGAVLHMVGGMVSLFGVFWLMVRRRGG